MADYDSSLPIRTENDGDVVSKISDATITSQQLKVNADGSIDTNSTVSATDLDIRDLDANQDNVAISDGTNTAAVNVSNELQVRDDDANTLLGTIDADTSSLAAGQLVDGHNVTVDNAAGVSAVNIQDGGNSITVDATDLDIRDLSATTDNLAISDGTDTLAINPDGSINVVTSGSNGTPVCEYDTSATVAKDASVNHDYTVTAAMTLSMEELWISGSGKLKAEILVNGATLFVGFNSASQPNIRIPVERVCTAAATQVVRITITNRDNQPQDVYSTLIGTEA